MYTAFDFKVNKPSAMGLNSLGTVVTPSGVTTEILYIEQPEGVRFYLRDVLNYPEYLECLDLPKIIEWFSRGLTWEKLEGESRLILRALPKPRRGIDLDLLANEAVKITRRFMLEYSVITPLLAWDELQDLTIDAPDADGLPRIFIRVRGFGDAYHPVIITPNKCQLAEPRTRLAKIISLLTGEASASTSEEALTFNAFIINKASERTRTSVTMYNPRGMATDAGLRLRVTMHAEPVSINTTAFRKHPEKPWHLGRLIASGTIDAETAGKILLASLGVKPYSIDGEPRGVLVYGPMGSGKTTLTAAIMNTYPPWVRVVAVQDVDEFKVLPIRTFNVLNTRASTGLGAKPITKAELIADAMRTGAQFVFVNEVLNPGDARAWVRAVTSGHGGATNLHAGSLEELIDRLERLGVRRAGYLVREFIITVRMENKRVVEVHVPKRADFTRPLPTLFRNYLEELGGNPEDYSLIMRMWADARCVIESGSIDCLEPVSIKTT